MGLHQINVGHAPEQDRLLVRISTTDRLEYRFWLTRHLVRTLWDGLLQRMQHAEPVRQQAAPQSRAAVLGFQHERALAESKFGAPYEHQELTPAQPGEPPLIVGVKLGASTAGGHALVFVPKAGAGITVQFNDRMLHAFSKLIRDAAAQARWDLPLGLPATQAPASDKVN